MSGRLKVTDGCMLGKDTNLTSFRKAHHETSGHQGLLPGRPCKQKRFTRTPGVVNAPLTAPTDGTVRDVSRTTTVPYTVTETSYAAAFQSKITRQHICPCTIAEQLPHASQAMPVPVIPAPFIVSASEACDSESQAS